MPAARGPPSSVGDWASPQGIPVTPAYFKAIQRDTIRWWNQHQRHDLPWRPYNSAGGEGGAPNPYYIWVSEVMSQQTQMNTVVKYFVSWIRAFPTIEALSKATEEEVRSVWSGMGYYRRAMYLRDGARYLIEQHKALVHKGARLENEPPSLPTSVSELLRVPGIGPYTAAAIASVCFGEPVTSVDGNVVRVLSRLRAERDFNPKMPQNIRKVNEWGQQLMLADGKGVCAEPGALNQGLMEIGASICRPSGSPLCGECPLQAHCGAYAAKQRGCIAAIEGVIPLRGVPPKKRSETVVCVVHEFCSPCVSSVATEGNNSERRFAVVRRPNGGLLGGMLEFPSLTLETVAVPPKGECKTEALSSDTEEKLKSPPASAGVDASEERRLVQRLSCGALKDECVGPSTPVGIVTHIFSHINMLVRVYYVRWTTGPSKTKAQARNLATHSDAEASVCSELERLMIDETARQVGMTASALRKDAERHKPLMDPVQQRVAVMTFKELHVSASSRLLLKVLNTLPSLAEDKKRSRSAGRDSSSGRRKKPATAVRVSSEKHSASSVMWA